MNGSKTYNIAASIFWLQQSIYEKCLFTEMLKKSILIERQKKCRNAYRNFILSCENMKFKQSENEKRISDFPSTRETSILYRVHFLLFAHHFVTHNVEKFVYSELTFSINKQVKILHRFSWKIICNEQYVFASIRGKF